MFEPKVFKKNGLEAFRLVGSDGSEFFYEGVIDCNENEIYRDEQGRLYYPVVTEMGGAIKYYVELAMDFPPIPSDPVDVEKEISRLVNVSPRSGRQLPEDVFVPQAEEAAPVEAPATEDPAAQALPEPEPVKEPAASEIVTGPAEPANVPESPREAEPPAGKPKKSKSMAVPIAIGVIVVVLIAAVVGVYVLKPGAFQGLTSLYSHPTPTPEPTPLPTEVPVVTATPEPTPVPTPEPQNLTTETLLQVQPLIDVGNGSLAGFTAEHVAANSAGNPIRQAYDLYTFVNGRWNDTDNESSAGVPASTLAQTLQGNSRDYSVLMCALANETGAESRIIAYYKDDQLYYYPEILVADNSSGYASAKADLKTWFGVAQPFGHTDDRGYWISMSRGTAPGTRVEASEEFAVYLSGAPVKIK